MAHRQRLPGPLPSFTKQPQQPPPPPEPLPRRDSSSTDGHSYGSGSDGSDDHVSEWSSGWSNEDSQYNGGAHSDGSWEDDSFRDSHNHSYGICGSEYNSISFE